MSGTKSGTTRIVFLYNLLIYSRMKLSSHLPCFSIQWIVLPTTVIVPDTIYEVEVTPRAIKRHSSLHP